MIGSLIYLCQINHRKGQWLLTSGGWGGGVAQVVWQPFHALHTPFRSRIKYQPKNDFMETWTFFLLKTTCCQVIILLYTMSQAHKVVHAFLNWISGQHSASFHKVIENVTDIFFPKWALLERCGPGWPSNERRPEEWKKQLPVLFPVSSLSTSALIGSQTGRGGVREKCLNPWDGLRGWMQQLPTISWLPISNYW